MGASNLAKRGCAAGRAHYTAGMSKTTIASIIVASLFVVAGCKNKGESNTTPTGETAAISAGEAAGFKTVSTTELNTWLTEKKVTVVDANGTQTRTETGYIPGAILLSSSEAFAASELPEDKNATLAFYCGSPQCTAAPTAAKKAQELGYANVVVYAGGIKGWVEAGMNVEKLAPATTPEAPAAQ